MVAGLSQLGLVPVGIEGWGDILAAGADTLTQRLQFGPIKLILLVAWIYLGCIPPSEWHIVR